MSETKPTCPKCGHELRELPRVYVQRFAWAMEMVLRENDHKGESWRTCKIDHLHAKAIEEALEYVRDLNYYRAGRTQELIDLANILMFIWLRGNSNQPKKGLEGLYGVTDGIR